jgi:succinoglycan biosynthesis protein ExoU
MASIPSYVAIVIAAYNAEATIGRAVRSALAEGAVGEVVVVDDASCDATVDAALAEDDGSGRLKILRQTENRGPSAARNRAIRESAASWIGILDADDFFLPGRIDGLLSFASDADLVADDIWQVSEADIDGPKQSLLDRQFRLPYKIGFDEFVMSNLTGNRGERTELGFIKPLIRRDFLNYHRISYQESMRLGEDFELYARALGNGARLWLVPPQGYVSVVRAGSLSSQHSEADLRQLRDSGERLARELNLSETARQALREHYLNVDCRLQWRLLIRAVKERNIGLALSSFLRPWPIPGHLASQLLAQLYLCVCGRREKTAS